MGFIVKNYDFFRMQDWYPKLSSNSFPAVFLTLKDAEIAALAAGETSGAVVAALIPRLKLALRTFSGSRFVSVDSAAPTDTERFLKKRGAVSSAESGMGGSCREFESAQCRCRRNRFLHLCPPVPPHGCDP